MRLVHTKRLMHSVCTTHTDEAQGDDLRRLRPVHLALHASQK
jgi:hypothetical protein